MSDFEDTADLAASFRDPASGEVDIELVLEEIAAIVERAKSMPLSSSVIVSREELLELITVAKTALPAELSRARRLLQDHDELRLRAEQESEQLLEAARAQAAHLVSRTEVARQARHDAERTILDADADARRIRHEAEDYVDRKLAAFEIVLDRTMRTVQAGRDRLAGAPAVPADDPAPEESANQDGDFIPFDQDR